MSKIWVSVGLEVTGTLDILPDEPSQGVLGAQRAQCTSRGSLPSGHWVRDLQQLQYTMFFPSFQKFLEILNILQLHLYLFSPRLLPHAPLTCLSKASIPSSYEDTEHSVLITPPATSSRLYSAKISVLLVFRGICGQTRGNNLKERLFILWFQSVHCPLAPVSWSRTLWQQEHMTKDWHSCHRRPGIRGPGMHTASGHVRDAQSAIELTEHSPENSKATLDACCRGKAWEDCSQNASCFYCAFFPACHCCVPSIFGTWYVITIWRDPTVLSTVWLFLEKTYSPLIHTDHNEDDFLRDNDT